MKAQPLFRGIIASILFAGCLLAMSAASISGLPSQSPSAVYKGIWKGQYEGRVFLVLILTPDDRGSLKGTIATGDIGVDENGEVNQVRTEAKDAVAISDVNLKEEALMFRAQNDNDLLSYHMRVAGTNKAKLKIDGAPPNVKPFTLERGTEHE